MSKTSDDLLLAVGSHTIHCDSFVQIEYKADKVYGMLRSSDVFTMFFLEMFF